MARNFFSNLVGVRKLFEFSDYFHAKIICKKITYHFDSKIFSFKKNTCSFI